ncbi:MAG: ribonuclease P protein component [Peptoniphilaceae bacterium]|nr:ribonuclease P protein component [Peptoniphilaceae bacterium]MDY5766206.1 ribonuclease P protein component [Peptoniphilaceae bacterium]
MEKKLRLRRNEDFTRVYRQGRASYNRDFKVVFRQNRKDHNRYGFSLSKKFGKAHERNRTKRQLREIVRLNQEIFPSGYDIVILPKESVKIQDYHRLSESLLHCVKQWTSKEKGSQLRR